MTKRVLATKEEYRKELDSLLDGKYVVIEDKDRKWWQGKMRSGFFTLLEDEEDTIPMKVFCQGRMFYFGSPTKKQVLDLLHTLFEDYRAND